MHIFTAVLNVPIVYIIAIGVHRRHKTLMYSRAVQNVMIDFNSVPRAITRRGNGYNNTYVSRRYKKTLDVIDYVFVLSLSLSLFICSFLSFSCFGIMTFALITTKLTAIAFVYLPLKTRCMRRINMSLIITIVIITTFVLSLFIINKHIRNSRVYTVCTAEFYYK